MFNAPMLLDFNGSKRSKITKACDNCRRRRVKCDGVPEGCGGCKAAKSQCVYTTSNTKRGPPKGYVEVIEDRLGKIESMLAGIVKKKKNPTAAASSSTHPHSQNENAQRATSSMVDDTENDSNDEDDHSSIYSTDLVEVKMQPPASPVIKSLTPTPQNSVRAGSQAQQIISPLGRHSPLISRNRSITSLLPFSHSDDQLPHPLPGANAHGSTSSTAASGTLSTDIAQLTSMFDKLGTTSIRTTVPFPWLSPEQSRQYGRNHFQFSVHSLEPPLPTSASSQPFRSSIPAHTLDEILDAYFTRINAFLPVVHKETFLKQWQHLTCNICAATSSTSSSSSSSTSSSSSSTSSAPQPWSRPQQSREEQTQIHLEHQQHPKAALSPLLLNALFAVAIMVNKDESQRQASVSQGFFDAARLLLDDYLDTPRQSTVQALCLMSQYHHNGQWKATRGSGYLSQAIRMAHELGLNHDPEDVSGADADGLRSLWWSLFIMDHQFSAWQGLGLLMNDKESNVEMPLEIPSSQEDMRGFVCLIRLVKILGSVLHHSYSAQSLQPQFGGHDPMISYIEGSLASWLSNLAPDMKWQNPKGSRFARGTSASPIKSPMQSFAADPKSGHISQQFPAYLYLVYNTTLILLHRPYIVGAAGSPAAAQSNTICTGSGRAITDIAQGLDMTACSFVVNRFALYALLQAGVIHAMNAVYDKRGTQVAMEYYSRTVEVLRSLQASSSYAGGVAEGIQILDQFLASTSKAAAEEAAEHGDSQAEDRSEAERMHEQQEGQPNRKKRQLEAFTPEPARQNSAMADQSVMNTPILQPHQFRVQQRSASITPSPLGYVQPTYSPSASTSSSTNNFTGLGDSLGSSSSLDFGLNQFPSQPYQHEYQLQQQQRQAELKEAQRQQQLKIQQHHLSYQQMQQFGAPTPRADLAANKAAFSSSSSTSDGIVSDEMAKLEQQQQQQRQLLRQQLQRQQQRQQMELEMKSQQQTSASQQQLPQPMMNHMNNMNTMMAPVIPSHRHALQMLDQQNKQQQQQQSMPMTMTMPLSVEEQNKMASMLHLGGTDLMDSMSTASFMTNDFSGYENNRLWSDMSTSAATTTTATSGAVSAMIGSEADVSVSSFQSWN